ncbi:hypothetical protein H2204_010902 [Knufia peltigerae]|nr:hypothetical protein H2204_010902 [Knufia peltigerae]
MSDSQRPSLSDSQSTLVSISPVKEKPQPRSSSTEAPVKRPQRKMNPRPSPNPPTGHSPRVKKTLLSENLGTQMTASLISGGKDMEAMDIAQRLKHLQAQDQSPPVYVTTQEMTNDILDHTGPETMIAASIKATEVDPTFLNSTKRPKDINTFTLHDFAAISALGSLVEKFGRVSHMGVLDPSYSFFLSKDLQSALYYKVLNNIAVIGGDPLCSPNQYDNLLQEFRRLRKRRGWGVAFLGTTDNFLPYAEQKKWVTMRFGTERVLNPLDNPILQEKEGKRVITQNRQLLDPGRGGISVHVYVPSQGRDEVLEQNLRHVYDSWRDVRNQSSRPQAYMTVFDPFAIPPLMTYIYTTDRDGQCNGFAALRKIGANKGYHIDPYCASPTAPKGITDLLVFSAMSLLRQAGIGYLSFGFEPATELGAITALSRPTTAVTRSCYRRAFRHLPIGGKHAYHNKFRPDPNLDSGLYIIYPEGAPSIQHALATLHIANIKVRGILRAELFRSSPKTPKTKTSEGGTEEQKGVSNSNN